MLRPIRMSDAPRFVKWLSDPSVNKFTTKKPVSLKEEKAWIKSISKQKNEVNFAIDTKEGIHIGSTNFHNIFKDDKYAVFDILIGDKRYWNKGYGTEASSILIDFGFKKLKLHRIGLSVYEYNPRAVALYKKLGFKLEGRKRESVLYKKKFYDELTMGLLRSEWLK